MKVRIILEGSRYFMQFDASMKMEVPFVQLNGRKRYWTQRALAEEYAAVRSWEVVPW